MTLANDRLSGRGIRGGSSRAGCCMDGSSMAPLVACRIVASSVPCVATPGTGTAVGAGPL